MILCYGWCQGPPGVTGGIGDIGRKGVTGDRGRLGDPGSKGASGLNVSYHSYNRLWL